MSNGWEKRLNNAVKMMLQKKQLAHAAGHMGSYRLSKSMAAKEEKRLKRKPRQPKVGHKLALYVQPGTIQPLHITLADKSPSQGRTQCVLHTQFTTHSQGSPVLEHTKRHTLRNCSPPVTLTC